MRSHLRRSLGHLVAVLSLAAPLASAQLSTGLVGYWPFDGDLLDASDTGADGTFVIGAGDPTLRFDTGQFGQGIDLNNFDAGSFDQHVDIAGVAEDSFDFTGGSMSFSLWVRSEFVGFANQAILAKGNGASWRFTSNGLLAGPAFSAGGSVATGDELLYPLDDNVLHHYVGVAEVGVGLKLYRDGELISEAPGNPNIADSPSNLFIGGNPQAANDNFLTWEGLIDDVGIWNRPLDAADVAQLWNNGNGVSIGEAIDPTDSDNDGMPDYYENTNGLNPDDPADAAHGADDGRFDNDGLTNLQEFNLSTDPNNPDSDDDGLTDGEEVSGSANTAFGNAPTGPLVADSDSDGLNDGDEVSGTANTAFGNAPTDPNDPDTDGDGATDPQEIAFGFDPNDLNNSPPPLQRGLKGFWTLDNTLEDGSGQGFDGVMLGTNPTPRYTTGKLGRAILLDGRTGVNQAVQIANSGSSFDAPGGSVTISTWVRLSIAPNAEPSIIGKGGDDNWRLTLNAATSELVYYGGADPITGGGSIAGPTWRHVVAISEAGVATRLYLDGFLVAVGDPPNLGSNGLPMEIGGNPDLPDMNWSGLLDEVAVWHRALSTGEVRQLWNAGRGILTADLIEAIDTDGDGMSDAYETAHGLDPALDDAALDLDGDGLSNKGEFEAGSDPNSADTDGDGLDDAAEAAAGTNPLGSDTDGDGLLDGVETNTGRFVSADDTGSDPLNPDTDGDGLLNDGREVAGGWDPNDPNDPVIETQIGALFLDGEGDYVTFPNTNGLIPSGSQHFTLEAWINPTSIPTGGGNGGQITFWGNQAGNQSNGFRLRGAAGVRHYFWGNDHDQDFGEDILPDTTGLNADGWHHLAFTYNGTETRWFWNGAQLGSARTVSNVAVANTNHRIGSRLDAEFFHGFIDEVRIWNVARTPEEIAENFELGLPPGQEGLVAYWNFNAAFNFDDATGNGHNGVALGDSRIDSLTNAPVLSAVTPTDVTLKVIELVSPTELRIDVSGVAEGQTLHLRESLDGQTFTPLATPFDLTRSTIFPAIITVNQAANPKALYQVYEGPSDGP